MMLKNVIEGSWKSPWMIVEYVEEIKKIVVFWVSHIFREGNKLADHLTNFALDYGPIECDSFAHLDT